LEPGAPREESSANTCRQVPNAIARGSTRVPRSASITVVAFVVLVFMTSACAAEPEDPVDRLLRDHPRDRAIAAGLGHLRAQQRPDGRIGENAPVAVTSLALLAHCAAGVTSDDPRHGPALVRALRWVLAQQDEVGYLGGKDGSRMYGHGIATLMLTQAMGTTRDDRLEPALAQAVRRAVAVTVAAAQVGKGAEHRGGWHYEPAATSSDLSLSGWQLMSCHAAQQVGIAVPPAVVDAAVAYAARLTGDDGKVGYQQPGQDHVTLRGLALLAFALAGQEDSPRSRAVVQRMLGEPPQWQGEWFFYRCWYEACGLSRAAPAAWDQHRLVWERLLLEHQRGDGSWPAPPGSSEGQYAPYGTAMAVLALAVERHVLPAYGR
jgi:hypothetical protein